MYILYLNTISIKAIEMLEGSCVLVFHKTIKVILNSCLTIKMRRTEFKIFIVTS